MADDGVKKQVSTDEAMGQETATEEIEELKETKEKSSNTKGIQKRQQNNSLLLNAMRTTAMHSTMNFPINPAGPTEVVIDTPVTLGRASATPTPSQDAVPKAGAIASGSVAEVIPKAPAGGGKKKRKRRRIVIPKNQALHNF